MSPPPHVRRFPAPWQVRALEACFTVTDAEGTPLAYVYFDDRPIAGTRAKLNREEARRVALNLAKLPALLTSQMR